MDVDGAPPPTPDELAERLGAVRLGARPPEGFTVIDERVPAQLTIQASTEEEAYAALAMRYGASEVEAIRANDPAWLEFSASEEQRASWLRLAAFLEDRFLHVSRCPKFRFIPFAGRWRKRTRPDAEIRCRAVVGLSPQGYAAAFASHGDSSRVYLFWRCLRSPDARDEPWQQHATMPTLREDALPSTVSIDRSTVSMWMPAGNTLVVVDLLTRTDAPRQIHLPSLSAPVVAIAANQERALLVLETGVLVVVDYLHSLQYDIRFCMRGDEPPAPPTPTPVMVNPMNPAVVMDAPTPPPPLARTPEIVVGRVVAVEFDELNSRGVVVSMAEGGWLAHGELPPPGTPMDDALAAFGRTLVYSVMGVSPTVGDREIKSPPREPAFGLLRRSVPGGEVSLAQCGQHVTWRADPAVCEYFERTGMATRFPTQQAFDCGPMFCVAVLGHTLVAQHRSGRVVISSLVPNPLEPDVWHTRFNIPTDGKAPVLLRAVPFRSLFITTTRIWALHASGELVHSRPSSKEEHNRLTRAHAASDTPATAAK